MPDDGYYLLCWSGTHFFHYGPFSPEEAEQRQESLSHWLTHIVKAPLGATTADIEAAAKTIDEWLDQWIKSNPDPGFVRKDEEKGE